jgi:hypothetical protein
MSSKAKDPAQQATPDNLAALMQRRDYPAFDRMMEDNMDAMVARVVKDGRLDQPYLPYLRHYAMTHEGLAGNLPPKILRGEGLDAAPAECSFKLWRKFWRAASRGPSASFANDRKLVRDHWARILAWDPHWIRRRTAATPATGWLPGDSYYAMCLTMADRALSAVSADNGAGQAAQSEWDRLGMNRIHQRLQWVLEVARDGTSRLPTSAVPGDALSAWTCMEGARDLAALTRCRQANPAVADEWQSYTDDRASWALLRLATAQRGVPAADLQAQLAQAADKVSKADFFTHFDYRAEAKLLKTIAKPATPALPVEKAVERMEAEFPDVKMAH